jgi:hypothetical protein
MKSLVTDYFMLYTISVEKGDDIKGFTTAVRGFLGHLVSNAASSLTRALLRPRFKPSKGGVELSKYYEAQLSRLDANFALCADLALVLGMSAGNSGNCASSQREAYR